MNNRIQIINDNQVRVCRNGMSSSFHTDFYAEDKFLKVHGCKGEQWDAEGIRAVMDVEQCFLATGNFAALRDDSAVQYPGKLMRRKLSNEIRNCFINPSYTPGKYKYECANGWGWVDETSVTILPLVDPKPKYRPYTAKEAVDHLGRWFVDTTRCNQHRELISVDATGVRDENDCHISYGYFADGCKWISGVGEEPCGVKAD